MGINTTLVCLSITGRDGPDHTEEIYHMHEMNDKKNDDRKKFEFRCYIQKFKYLVQHNNNKS